MVRKGRGLKSGGIKGRGLIVLRDAPIVKMGVRLKTRLDERTQEAIVGASSEYISVAGGHPVKRGGPPNPELIQKRFGERVRALRQEKEISQESLAFVCDLDRAYIGGVERGERNISLVNIYKIARGLKVPAKELMP
jgi:ribosome-binding protein aMBF1 (putative translation factor)